MSTESGSINLNELNLFDRLGEYSDLRFQWLAGWWFVPLPALPAHQPQPAAIPAKEEASIPVQVTRSTIVFTHRTAELSYGLGRFER